MSTNDRQLLEMIDAALVRIEDGQYGKCIHCGQPILEKRLEAVPWARYCLRCADLNERGLLHRDEEELKRPPISDLKVLKSEILDDIIRGLLGNPGGLCFSPALARSGKEESE